jgi:hypothetical protein
MFTVVGTDGHLDRDLDCNRARRHHWTLDTGHWILLNLSIVVVFDLIAYLGIFLAVVSVVARRGVDGAKERQEQGEISVSISQPNREEKSVCSYATTPVSLI